MKECFCHDDAFNKLVEIVCKRFDADPVYVLGRSKAHTNTTPKNIIAALWSRHATLRETAIRLGWKSMHQVCNARLRAARLAAMPTNCALFQSILDDLEKEIPWLVADDDLEAFEELIP